MSYSPDQLGQLYVLADRLSRVVAGMDIPMDLLAQSLSYPHEGRSPLEWAKAYYFTPERMKMPKAA